MKELHIYQSEAKTVFRELSRQYNIIAPVKKAGGGRLSNTDLVTYGNVGSFGEIEFFDMTYFSPKEILFPTRQDLFEFKDDVIYEIKEDIVPTIVFLRSCDIHAVQVMDAHFIGNSGFKDIYYKRRRDAVKFFLIECRKPFENCFCASMGTNKTENYSVFMRKTEDGYEVDIKDKEFMEYFSQGKKKKVKPSFVERDANPIDLPEEIDPSLFENEMWKEYSIRCIACGRCNTSCPTCACFSVRDINPEDGQGQGKRTRIWSSCQVKDFAILAGKHDFRIPKGDKMRYRVLHKIRDFRRMTGMNMCVGCGRCDDVCPEYISMFKCIEKINSIINEKGSDG